MTAWVAFTAATEANGAMEYVPGSHKLEQILNRDTFAKHNLLTRGQEVMPAPDPGEAPSPLRLVKPHRQPTRAASASGG